MKYIYFSIIGLLLVSACKRRPANIFIELNSIPITAEGPLFEGSNTGQAQINNPLDGYFKDQGAERKDLTMSQLTNLVVTLEDSTNFNNYESITFQLVAEGSDMVKVAFINPIPQDATSLTLTVAENQDKLVEVMKQDKIYLVADAIIKSDVDSDMKLKCNFKFKIDHK